MQSKTYVPSTADAKVCGELCDPGPVTLGLGSRLRAVRAARGLSLGDLARRSGLDVDVLVEMEAGGGVPSLGLLWKIAAGLGVAFADLLGRSGAASTVLRRGEAKVLRSEDRVMESRPLVTAGASRWVEAYELTLAARSTHASEPHPSGTREIVVVLSGTLILRMESGVHHLELGDSISFQADLPHVYENSGAVEGRYHDIIVYEY